MIRSAAINLVTLAACAFACAAHPFHLTIAEVELGPEGDRLEVALRVWPEDLEAVLAERLGERVNIEKTDDIDTAITDMLSDVFVVHPPGDRPPADWTPPRPKPPAPADPNEQPSASPGPVVWIGKEVSHADTWLYFEYRLPAGVERLEELWISNRFGLREFEAQENFLRLRFGDRTATARCTALAPWALSQREPAPRTP